MPDETHADQPATERAEERRARRRADHRHARRARLALRPLLLAAGALHLALGAFMALAPRQFYDGLAAFPPYNGHFLRDLATFYLALGAAMLIAAARRSWQVPVLTLALVQYVLHFVNHVKDVGDTDPSWIGPFNLVALALLAAALLWLLRTAQTDPRA